MRLNVSGLCRLASWVLSGALVAGYATSASANNSGPGLDDPPYWNLWDSADDVANGTLSGMGDTITLCGSLNCTGLNQPSSNLSGEGIFRVYTGGEWDASAGSGHLDPFLRFAHTEKADDGTYQIYGGDNANASAGAEAAYNTNYGSHTSDLEGRTDPGSPDTRDFINQAKDHPGTQFNHAVRFTDMFQVDADGNAVTDGSGYVEFLLDINEPNAGDKSFLRMDELKIFISTTDQLNDFDVDGIEGSSLFDNKHEGTMVAPTGESVAKVWDMDVDKDWGGTDGTDGSECYPGLNSQVGCGGVYLNNEVGTGGQGDVDYSLLIKVAAFQEAAAAMTINLDDAWVFLYNYAGDADKKSETTAEANFEEWAFRSKFADSPEPPSSIVTAPAPLWLVGIGLVAFARHRRARAAA